MSASVLLDRLEKVRQTGPGRWIASCPAHVDTNPSLSVRELDDGRILIHDFGGCDASDVMSAVGLTLADLFPAPLSHHAPKSQSKIPASDRLAVIAHEAVVVMLAAEDLAEGKQLTEEFRCRMQQAVGRINAALEEGNR